MHKVGTYVKDWDGTGAFHNCWKILGIGAEGFHMGIFRKKSKKVFTWKDNLGNPCISNSSWERVAGEGKLLERNQETGISLKPRVCRVYSKKD